MTNTLEGFRKASEQHASLRAALREEYNTLCARRAELSVRITEIEKALREDEMRTSELGASAPAPVGAAEAPKGLPSERPPAPEAAKAQVAGNIGTHPTRKARARDREIGVVLPRLGGKKRHTTESLVLALLEANPKGIHAAEAIKGVRALGRRVPPNTGYSVLNRLKTLNRIQTSGPERQTLFQPLTLTAPAPPAQPPSTQDAPAQPTPAPLNVS